MKNQPNMEIEEKPSAATSSDTSLKQSSLSSESRILLMSQGIYKNQFLIPQTSFAANTESNITYKQEMKSEEEFMSQLTSAASGGSNVTVEHDNGLDCKIEAKHSSASLPGTSSMPSFSTNTNEEFVEPNAVRARRRQLNLANGDNKMPPIKKPKVSPDSDQDQRKNKNRPLAPKYLSKKICKYFMLLLLSMIFICSIAVYISESQDRKHSSDYASAVAELKKRIYGQDNAIDQLSKYLPLDTPRSKIIVLVGGTGVGKSYTVDIIKKNFPRQYAIRQYFPPIRTGFEFKIPFLHPDLIIMENLKERDLMDTVDFLERYQDTCKDRFVTLLAVFNFEHIDDHLLRSINIHRSLNAIENAFLNKNINVEIIPYNSLVEDALEQCIMDAIRESKLSLTKRQLTVLKQNLVLNNVGCKGAYNKVQMIGRQ